MIIASLPYEFNLFDNIKLKNGEVHKIVDIFDMYNEKVDIFRDGNQISFTLTDSMVDNKIIHLTIVSNISNKNITNKSEIDIEIDFIIPIRFKCLPFRKMKMFNNII